MSHYQFEISLNPFEPWSEILSAYLGDIDFEGFYEQKNILHAFVSQSNYSEERFHAALKLLSPDVEVQFVFKELTHRNWNALWESNFEPVFIENKLAIVAPFHTLKSRFEHVITIEPKMSFGTGHHQTTFMMCEEILVSQFEKKAVLDMGSGTGVLAILCELVGAKSIIAVDIEAWSVENCRKNAEVNNCSRITSVLGDIDVVKDHSFDVIFANINKNILLNHMAAYVRGLNPNGFLYLSGFFSSDAQEIIKEAQELGLNLISQKERGGWCLLVFNK